MLVPFLSQAKRIQANRPVHHQHSCQVVDLVLQQLGHVALEIDRMKLPAEVLISDLYPAPRLVRTIRLMQQKQSSQTVKSSFPTSTISGLISTQGRSVSTYTIESGAPIWGAAIPRPSVPHLQVTEGLFEVIDNHPDSGRAGIGYGRAS